MLFFPFSFLKGRFNFVGIRKTNFLFFEFEFFVPYLDGIVSGRNAANLETAIGVSFDEMWDSTIDKANTEDDFIPESMFFWAFKNTLYELSKSMLR